MCKRSLIPENYISCFSRAVLSVLACCFGVSVYFVDDVGEISASDVIVRDVLGDLLVRSLRVEGSVLIAEVFFDFHGFRNWKVRCHVAPENVLVRSPREVVLDAGSL